MIHHVFANRSNIGDWLSALGIQSFLKPQSVIEHLCDEPFVPNSLAELAKTTAKDLIVIGGGGLFLDYFVPFWKGIRDGNIRAPVCIWGVGYCDLKARSSHPPLDLILDCIHTSHVCVVRDQLTGGYLGAECNLEVAACPSLGMISPNPGGFGLLHVDNYTAVGPDVFAAMDEISREWARREGRPYRRTNNRISQGSEGELQSTLALYRASDLVVSSALHGCIIAAAMGKPVCAISGDRKIEAFMEAAGLGNWVLDTQDVVSLSHLLCDLSTQDPISGFVQAECLKNRNVAKQIKSILAAI